MSFVVELAVSLSNSLISRNLSNGENVGEKLESTMGCAAAILFLGFGVFQLGAGWLGIEESYSWGWGLAAVIAATMFRFTIPIVFGAFLCAQNIWGWHWAFAALFAAPGLLFMVPALVAALIGSVKR